MVNKTSFGSNRKLLIPSGVENELKNLFFRDNDMQERVGAVLELLEQKQAEGVVCVCGQEGITFADQQILSIAAGALLGETARFITRDKNLSEDLLHLNELSSVHGNKLVVNRINKFGYLSRYVLLSEREYTFNSDEAAPPLPRFSSRSSERDF